MHSTFDEDEPVDNDVLRIKGHIEDEIKMYRKEPPLLATNENEHPNPYQWWKDHALQLPLLAATARKWLAVPASSAASERLFSTAGITVTDRRNRLGGARIATLTFLKSAWDALEKLGVLYGADSAATATKSTPRT